MPEVKKVYVDSQSEIKKLETEFFSKCGREMNADDMEGEIKSLHKKMTNAKALIKHWKIL